MRIYTRSGDRGETGLANGRRVSKASLRVDVYGTLDELNSIIGILKDTIPQTDELSPQQVKITCGLLNARQHEIFALSSLLAFSKQPQITEEHLKLLEEQIDTLTKTLPKLTQFLIPGGCLIGSYSHLARSTCRRAERLMTELQTSEQVDEIWLRYINRLSDWFFTLARHFHFETQLPETMWNPNDEETSRN